MIDEWAATVAFVLFVLVLVEVVALTLNAVWSHL